MPRISINIISKKPQKIFGVDAYLGEIAIGQTFKESFFIPINWWKIEDYKKQWKDGLNRIRHEKTSCLVATAQGPSTDPLLSLWVLYRDGSTVTVQNHLLTGSILFNKVLAINNISSFNFSVTSCYDYILPQAQFSDDGEAISQWITSIK